MDEMEIPKWFERIEVDGRRFATAKEYTDYMTEHRLWGPHSKILTKEEWEAEKAKMKSEGVELGILKFTPGDSRKGGEMKI